MSIMSGVRVLENNNDMKKFLFLFIGIATFLGTNIKTITNNSLSFEVDEVTNTLYNSSKTQLIFSPEVRKLTVPSTVEYVWPYAFSGNVMLETINLSNVETIGANAFHGCLKLISITADSLSHASQTAFMDTQWFQTRGDVTILGSEYHEVQG